MIKAAHPYFEDIDNILSDIGKVLESGRLMNGTMTETFEKEFARYTVVNYAISVNSCTTALEIVLRFLDVKDQEVIVPTNTFVATANAVIYAGGIPVLADIKDKSYNISLEEMKKLKTKKTKAVIIVHIAGFICEDIVAIKEFCEQEGIYLIEDCAHAAGASFNNEKAGSFGFAGCFSFYPTKVMTTGTGGMITTSSLELVEYASRVKYHGRDPISGNITDFGNDWFMDEIRACIGIHQLHDLGSMVAKRRKVAKTYITLLQNVDDVEVFVEPALSEGCYYKFPVQIGGNINIRDLIDNMLTKHNIEIETLYSPLCHLQPVYRERFGYKENDFPVSEEILSRQVTLPIHSMISQSEAEYVVSKLKSEVLPKNWK